MREGRCCKIQIALGLGLLIAGCGVVGCSVTGVEGNGVEGFLKDGHAPIVVGRWSLVDGNVSRPTVIDLRLFEDVLESGSETGPPA